MQVKNWLPLRCRCNLHQTVIYRQNQRSLSGLVLSGAEVAETTIRGYTFFGELPLYVETGVSV
jgi:hypothetical protein